MSGRNLDWQYPPTETSSSVCRRANKERNVLLLYSHGVWMKRQRVDREKMSDLHRSKGEGIKAHLNLRRLAVTALCHRNVIVQGNFAAARKLVERINRLIAILLRVNLLALLCLPSVELSLL